MKAISIRGCGEGCKRGRWISRVRTDAMETKGVAKMGQAFDRDGNVLGEAYGETMREVLDQLQKMHPTAEEIRIRHLRDGETLKRAVKKADELEAEERLANAKRAKEILDNHPELGQAKGMNAMENYPMASGSGYGGSSPTPLGMVPTMKQRLEAADGSWHGNDLQATIASALNRFSAENASNTPDFILAQFLMGCLDAWNRSVQDRETWYGRSLPAIATGGSGPAPVDPRSRSVD